MISNLILNPSSTLNDLFFGFSYKSKPYILHIASLNKDVANGVKEIKISKLKFSRDLKEYQTNQLDINKDTYQLQLDLIDYISKNHTKYFAFLPKAFLFNLPYNSKLIDKFKLEVTKILKRNMSYITKNILSSEETDDSKLKWLFFSSVTNLNNLFLPSGISKKAESLGIDDGELFDFNLKIPRPLENQIKFIDFIIEHPDIFAKPHYTFNTSSDFFLPIEKETSKQLEVSVDQVKSEIQLNEIELGFISDINENLKSTFSQNSIYGLYLKKFINIDLLNFRPFIQNSTDYSKKDGLNIIDIMIKNNLDDDFQTIVDSVFSNNFNGYIVSSKFLNEKNKENCKKLRNDPEVLKLVKESLKTEGMYIYYLWVLNCIHNNCFYVSDGISTSNKLYFQDVPYIFEETILKGSLKNTKTTYNILSIEKIFKNNSDLLNTILYKFDSINFLLSEENWKKLEIIMNDDYKNNLNIIYKKINQMFDILKLENTDKSYKRIEELSGYLKNYILGNYRYYINYDLTNLLVKLSSYFRIFEDTIDLSKDVLIRKLHQISEDGYDLFYKIIQLPIKNNNKIELYPFNYFLDKESFIEKYNFLNTNVFSGSFTEHNIDDILINRKLLFELLLPITHMLTESTDVPFKQLPNNIENLEVFTTLENYIDYFITKEAKTLFKNYHDIVWWVNLYKKEFGDYDVHNERLLFSSANYEIEFDEEFDYFNNYKLTDDKSLKLDQRLFNYVYNIMTDNLKIKLDFKDKNIHINYKDYKTVLKNLNSLELSPESKLLKEINDLGIKIDIDNIKEYFKKIIVINKENSKKTLIQLTNEHILNELQKPSHRNEEERKNIVNKKQLLLQYTDAIIYSNDDDISNLQSNPKFSSILVEPEVDSIPEKEIDSYIKSFKSEIKKIGDIDHLYNLDNELSENFSLNIFKQLYTQDERKYLNYYTESSSNYNKTLRKSLTGNYNSNLTAILSIVSAFSNSLSYSDKNLILYRSSDNNAWLNEKIAGDYIVEPGFLSTSISLNSVKDFIKNPNTGILYIIYAPKKTNGIYVKEISDVMEEKEFLLNCGSIFKILKIENRNALPEKNPLSGAAGLVYHLFYIGNISLSIINTEQFKNEADNKNKKLYQDLVDIYNNKGNNNE